MVKKSSNKTFIEISNKDIFEKLLEMDNKLGDIEQHVIKTNGKVRVAQWSATTALTLIISTILIFVGVAIK